MDSRQKVPALSIKLLPGFYLDKNIDKNLEKTRCGWKKKAGEIDRGLLQLEKKEKRKYDIFSIAV